MHVELNYLLKILWPLHLLCFLATSGCLCMLISMLQDNSKRRLHVMPGYWELDPSMCSNFDLAYRFLHYLVGSFDHIYGKALHETELYKSAGTRCKRSPALTGVGHCTHMFSEHVQFCSEYRVALGVNLLQIKI